MVLYWRDRPFKVDTDPYREYIYELEMAIELALPMQDDEKLHAEGEFYVLAGYALLTEFYDDVGSNMKAIGAARKAYHSLKEGFELKEKFPDFYFPTGVYNYYREKYPELHPFYKSFMWLFVSGDLELGLEQLKIAYKKGVFTQREALIYLFHLYLRYENKPEVALPYAKMLIERFPENDKFKCLYIEAMLYNGDTRIPCEIINSLLNNKMILYQLAGHLFKGLIAERNNNIPRAQEYLETALKLYETMDKEEDHFLSLIYMGMARIAVKQKDHKNARAYYKLASKYAPFVPVKVEADNYLESDSDG
jgi:tetratricopeptide (TPR) repeat protein